MSGLIPAQRSPYAFAVEARRQPQPLRGGSRRGSGLTTVHFAAAEDKRGWLCGCKATAGKPFCDGTHNRL